MFSEVRRLAVACSLVWLVGVSIVTKAAWFENDWNLPRPCAPEDGLPVLDYELVRTAPHDRNAYTQGLLVSGDVLFESTGLYGESDVRRVALRTGEVLARQPLPGGLFGEGLALVGDELIQLTWNEGAVRRYRAADLALVAEQTLGGEAWGLTFDSRSLIQSDGSDTLYFRDPGDLREQRRLQVTAAGRPVTDINELEYADGRLLANVFRTTCVAVIEPSDGKVTAWIDLSELAKRARRLWRRTDVANGIAYDTAADSYYVTGKFWPEMYEIRVDALNAR